LTIVQYGSRVELDDRPVVLWQRVVQIRWLLPIAAS
jgi:hypothetical protein